MYFLLILNVFLVLIAVYYSIFLQRHNSKHNLMYNKFTSNVSKLTHFSRFIQYSLLVSALILLGSTIFFYLYESLVGLVLTSVIFLFSNIVLLLTYREKRQPQLKSNSMQFLGISLLVFILAVIAISIYFASRQPNIKIAERSILVSGAYGFKIKVDELSYLGLVDSLPRIKLRSNGIDLGKIKKGHFILDDLGECRLMLRNQIPPFIKIESRRTGVVFINFSTTDETNKFFNEINTTKNDVQ